MSTTATQTTESATGTLKLKAAYNEKTHSTYKYSDYLPVYDETTTFPPTEPFEVRHRGLDADKTKPNLLNSGDPNVEVTRLTPRVGTEIKGLQLSQLSDAQKDELALLVAERGVVVFRDQDFKDIGLEKQKEFGEYFGRLHVHVGDQLFCKDYLRESYANSKRISPSDHMSRTTSSSTTSTSGLTIYIASSSGRPS